MSGADRPRTPAAFEQWAARGRELMALHIGYETVEPFTLQRRDMPDVKARDAGQQAMKAGPR